MNGLNGKLNSKNMMDNLLIFGVGLIGGSIALDCQKKTMFYAPKTKFSVSKSEKKLPGAGLVGPPLLPLHAPCTSQLHKPKQRAAAPIDLTSKLVLQLRNRK